MLTLRLEAFLKSKGIEKPYPYLKKNRTQPQHNV